MSQITQKKRKLREEVRFLKKQFTHDELVQKSSSATQQLEQNPYFKKAKTVMIYNSLHDEVDTSQLIKKLFSEKQIILPSVVGDDILPLSILPHTQLQRGAFNIMEPISEPFEGEIDLIIIPGMAFDKSGHRLGRGRGFYDRFLTQNPNIYTIGLCFDFQYFDEVPYDTLDKTVDEVIVTD